MKNLAFHRLLRWTMVILPILTTSQNILVELECEKVKIILTGPIVLQEAGFCKQCKDDHHNINNNNLPMGTFFCGKRQHWHLHRGESPNVPWRISLTVHRLVGPILLPLDIELRLLGVQCPSASLLRHGLAPKALSGEWVLAGEVWALRHERIVVLRVFRNPRTELFLRAPTAVRTLGRARRPPTVHEGFLVRWRTLFLRGLPGPGRRRGYGFGVVL